MTFCSLKVLHSINKLTYLLTSNKGFEENCIKIIGTLLFPAENSDELSVLIDT